MGALDDTAQWVDIITGVDNGDAATADEFNQAPEQLAKRTSYLKQQVDNGTSTHADTAIGAETSSRIHGLGSSSSSTYWLVDDATIVSGTNLHRVYRDVSRNGLIVVTVNAEWDAETSRWNRTSGAHASAKFELGPPLGGSNFSRGIVVQTASLSVTSGGWTDAEWDGSAALGYDSVRAGTFLSLLGNPGPGDTVPANSLFAPQIAKAGATITVASGVITVLDGYNVNQGAMSVSGTSNLIVPFRTPMANANYRVLHGGGYTGGEHQQVVTKNTTDFQIRIVDASGTPIDITATTRTFEFEVKGLQ